MLRRSTQASSASAKIPNASFSSATTAKILVVSPLSEFIARATAGYCFSPLFGLLGASRDFAALYP